MLYNQKAIAMCKCSYIGCKEESTVKVENKWGVKPSYTNFCEDHKPDWVKTGLAKSPESIMFGIKKSWYAISK